MTDELIFIGDEYGHMEMPAPCHDCQQISELNSLMSCSDGEVRCRSCHALWVEDLDDGEDA